MNSVSTAVRNKCEFCWAFFSAPLMEVEHNRKCEFRLSRTFVSSDGKVKFVCTVCRDVFATEFQLKTHENLHKYPGGYACPICDAIFRNDAARIQHEATTHQILKCLWCEGDKKISTIEAFSAHLETEHNGNGCHAMCTICGAQFEQNSYLRLHVETNCGQLGMSNCSECGVECVSEISLSEHKRMSHAIIPIEDVCIKLEENPLILPKIEVSSIERWANGSEYDSQTHNVSTIGLEMVNDDDNAFGVGNAGAQTNCKQEDPIDVEAEYDSNDEKCGSENSDCDHQSNGMDYLNVIEPWTYNSDRTFECNTCQSKFKILGEIEEHVTLHGPVRDRVYQCKSCTRHYSTIDKLREHRAKEHHQSDQKQQTPSCEKYKCSYCDWEYTTMERREKHMKLHGPNGDLVHKCSCCNFFFATHKEMLTHRFNAHKQTVCNVCRPRLTFKSPSVLTAHIKKKHPKTGLKHKCRICLVYFRSAMELAEHGRDQHTATTCAECGKIFAKAVDIRRHTSKRVCQKLGVNAVEDEDVGDECSMDSMTENGEASVPVGEINVETDRERSDDNADVDSIDSSNVASSAMDNAQRMKIMEEKLDIWKSRGVRTTSAVCTICHTKYGYVWHFEKHIKIHGSSGQQTIKCKHCPERLASTDDLERHVARIHNHPCHLCDRTYLLKKTLRIHLESAHERYKCDKCGTTFNRKVGLNRHILTDCDTIPQHKCVFCDAVFHTAIELKEHEDVHENETGQVCSTCGKLFEKLSSLKLHMVQAHRRSFECRYCGSSFKSRHHLLKHLSEHTSISPFKCLSCKEQFSSMGKLETHRSENATTCNLIPITDECIINIDADDADTQFNLTVKPNEFPCKYCGWIFASTTRRKTHSTICALNQSVVERYRCEECNITFARRKDRMEHKEKVHKGLNCNYCDKKFHKERGLMNHILLHGPDGKLLHKCVCCLRHFATVEARTKHEHDEHMDKLKCKVCGKMVKDPTALKTHVENMHEQKHKQICTKCGRAFQSKKSLLLHEESDCGKTPSYKCEHCGKCLFSLYTLRSHIDVLHADSEKKFICSYCGKAWHSKSGLTSHLRNHTGEKPYKCDYCEKRFAFRSTKMTHETTHTGIKPYMCQCGDRFSCISNLQSHRKARKTTCGLLPLISKRFPDKTSSINLESV